MFVEIKGTALNAFDRLVASGDVVVDGYLNIDIDEVSPGVPFVPALGNTFNIITGNTVTGEFDFADVSGMPAGLAFHIDYLANAVQLQVVNKPFFSADFDDDGDVDATDLAIWDGAFDLNQLGDADGDNDTDGADLLMWQQQFGSRPGGPPANAVPEPTSLLLLLIACMTCAIAFWRHRGKIRIRLAIVSTILTFALAHTAVAQTVNLSLNVEYTDPANLPEGGVWTLVAKTDSPHGISLINAILSNIDDTGITAQDGIGAFLNGGSPFVGTFGSTIQVVYLQNLSTPASVVMNVGRGAGTPGNVAVDFLNDPQWNNSAKIFSGTFGNSSSRDHNTRVYNTRLECDRGQRPPHGSSSLHICFARVGHHHRPQQPRRARRPLGQHAPAADFGPTPPTGPTTQSPRLPAPRRFPSAFPTATRSSRCPPPRLPQP